MKPWILTVALLSLAACAPTHQWTKSGIAPQVADADYDDCRRSSQRVAEDHFRHERDIVRVRSATERREDRIGSAQIDLQRLDAERDFERARLLRRCMEDRGYSLVAIPPA